MPWGLTQTHLGEKNRFCLGTSSSLSPENGHTPAPRAVEDPQTRRGRPCLGRPWMGPEALALGRKSAGSMPPFRAVDQPLDHSSLRQMVLSHNAARESRRDFSWPVSLKRATT